MITVKRVVVGVFVAMILVVLSSCGPEYYVASPPASPEDTPPPNEDQANPAASSNDASGTSGRVVFAITDAAANMQTVTSVKVTVNAVRVHSAAEGWVTVSSTPHTYDLLQLKAASTQALIADVELKPGSYDQIRLDISSVTVTDANGSHQAKLPSGELKIMGQLLVTANTTSTATVDFIADESLHTTGNGGYILAPVVQLETRTNADVVVRPDRMVDIAGGNVRTRVKVGMDIDGNVGVGLKIGKDQAVSVDGEKLKLGVGAENAARGNVGLGVSG